MFTVHEHKQMDTKPLCCFFFFPQVLILAADEERSDGGQVDLHGKHWSPAGLSPCSVYVLNLSVLWVDEITTNLTHRLQRLFVLSDSECLNYKSRKKY